MESLVIIEHYDDLDVMDVPVITVPAMANDVYTGYNAVMNPLDNTTYYMGKEYKPLPNKDIIEMVRGLVIADGFEFHRGVIDERGRYEFCLEAPVPAIGVDLGNGKKHEARCLLNILNSYDGSASLRAGIGGKISYCQNIFGLPTKFLGGEIRHETRRKHLGNVEATLTDLKNAIPRILNEWESSPIATKVWSGDPAAFAKVQREVIKAFGAEHKVTASFNMRARMIEEREWNVPEFSAFMAITNMTTFPESYALKTSHVEKLKEITHVFWN